MTPANYPSNRCASRTVNGCAYPPTCLVPNFGSAPGKRRWVERDCICWTRTIQRTSPRIAALPANSTEAVRNCAYSKIWIYVLEAVDFPPGPHGTGTPRSNRLSRTFQHGLFGSQRQWRCQWSKSVAWPSQPRNLPGAVSPLAGDRSAGDTRDKRGTHAYVGFCARG